MKPRELVNGFRIERLVVIAKQPSVKGHSLYEFLCDCGNKVIVRGSAVLSGNTKSCGCMNTETRKNSGKVRMKPGVRDINGKITPEYGTWRHMKARCYRVTDPKYPSYGARGITVCDRWLKSFTNFITDMGRKPNPTDSLDRINNDGNYEPSNCRWASPAVQSSNKRTNVYLSFRGLSLCQAEFARMVGVTPKAIENHRRKGRNGQQIINHYVHRP